MGRYRLPRLSRIGNMTLPAPIEIQGDPRKPGFRVLCNVCGRPVDMWKIQTPVARAPFDPSNAMDTMGMVRMANTGEVIFSVEYHGEYFGVSNWRGVIASSNEDSEIKR